MKKCFILYPYSTVDSDQPVGEIIGTDALAGHLYEPSSSKGG